MFQLSIKRTEEEIMGGMKQVYKIYLSDRPPAIGQCFISENHYHPQCGIKYNNILFALIIHPDFRNYGFGQYFLEEIVKDFKKPIKLYCHTRTLNFYKRCGFVKVKRKFAMAEHTMIHY